VQSLLDTKVSVVVPLYDPNLELEHFVTRLMENLYEQTLLPNEIVFSSNHNYPIIQKFIKEYGKSIKIRVVVNKSQNAAENLNSAMSHAQNELIKIMFQDDYFLHQDSLEILVKKLMTSKRNWLICGSRDMDLAGQSTRRYKIPSVGKGLVIGRNSVSDPSVVLVKRSHLIYLDPDLLFLVDCDWYLKMWHRFGRPARVLRPQVGVQIHSAQATHTLKEHLSAEVEKLKIIHSESPGLIRRTQCACLQLNQEALDDL